jgi:hypothetical protein
MSIFQDEVRWQKIQLVKKVATKVLGHEPTQLEQNRFKIEKEGGTEYIVYNGKTIGRIELEQARDKNGFHMAVRFVPNRLSLWQRFLKWIIGV